MWEAMAINSLSTEITLSLIFKDLAVTESVSNKIDVLTRDHS